METQAIRAIRAELTRRGLKVTFNDGSTYVLAEGSLFAACVKHGEFVYGSDADLYDDRSQTAA